MPLLILLLLLGQGRGYSGGRQILLQRCRLQLGDLTRPDLTLIRVGKQYVDALQLRVTMRVLKRERERASQNLGEGQRQLQRLIKLNNLSTS